MVTRLASLALYSSSVSMSRATNISTRESYKTCVARAARTAFLATSGVISNTAPALLPARRGDLPGASKPRRELRGPSARGDVECVPVRIPEMP